MVKFWCFNVLALYLSFYVLCFTLYGAVIKHKEYFFPSQTFSFTQVKYKGMHCFGIHFGFFFLFKILSVVIIGSFTHLFFYSFSPPTFYPFFFLIQELWICVYRIYNKNVYISLKNWMWIIFWILKTKNVSYFLILSLTLKNHFLQHSILFIGQ